MAAVVVCSPSNSSAFDMIYCVVRNALHFCPPLLSSPNQSVNCRRVALLRAPLLSSKERRRAVCPGAGALLGLGRVRGRCSTPKLCSSDLEVRVFGSSSPDRLIEPSSHHVHASCPSVPARVVERDDDGRAGGDAGAWNAGDAFARSRRNVLTLAPRPHNPLPSNPRLNTGLGTWQAFVQECPRRITTSRSARVSCQPMRPAYALHGHQVYNEARGALMTGLAAGLLAGWLP